MNAKKLISLKAASAAALSLSLLMSASCSSLPKGETSKQVITKEGVPGLYAVETYKTTATVTSIDAAKRAITIVDKEGKKQDLKAGPAVANFDQIRIGDQIVITVADELVVYMAKDAVPTPDGSSSLIASAAKGEKPGMVIAGTCQVTATVAGLDRNKRKAMLKMPDGTTKTVSVRQDVDLSKYSVGDGVVFRTTEAVAVSIEKP